MEYEFRCWQLGRCECHMVRAEAHTSHKVLAHWEELREEKWCCFPMTSKWKATGHFPDPWYQWWTWHYCRITANHLHALFRSCWSRILGLFLWPNKRCTPACFAKACLKFAVALLLDRRDLKVCTKTVSDSKFPPFVSSPSLGYLSESLERACLSSPSLAQLSPLMWLVIRLFLFFLKSLSLWWQSLMFLFKIQRYCLFLP